MDYIILLILIIVIADLFYSFKPITFQITGSYCFKYNNKYYEHFFCIYKKTSRYFVFNTKNYKEELLNNIIRSEVESYLKNIYKFKYIEIWNSNNLEITSIKKKSEFYYF